MHSRRDFLQRAAILSGSGFLFGSIPESILAALSIDPEVGSSYLDAEHIVILMQENRSFDHAYGAMRGVRGFGDPRIFVQPNGVPAWFQANDEGKTYGPFHLDIKDSKATWMGSLPHSWLNQNDARNFGRYDNWLAAKASSTPEYAKMPLTMGFYTRQDIPFYYALADAFTVCDQNFCSSLTGTNPNRLYFWTGTVRPTHDNTSFARVRNEEIDYGVEADWTTFPERLEEAGVSWKIYQNEVSITNGFSDDEDFWLSSFGDNPLEWFTQYNIRFTKGHQNWIKAHKIELAKALADAEKALAATPSNPDLAKKVEDLKKELHEHDTYTIQWAPEKWNQLDEKSKRLHEKAFVINDADPNYRTLDKLKYDDAGVQREAIVPAGDVLHQFRKDVESGQLPTVSWLVAPESFSDHPSSAWYGAWYLAESFDILTKNPEAWKKTIFILTYDENDGYFDHCQPFVAPHPSKPETGKTSSTLDTAVDYVELEQDEKRYPAADARGGSIGLGFRVPMVVASPWSRGGAVCSQIFDHTSTLMFLEKFLSAKTGKTIHDDNITPWRRTVCGDLTTLFKPHDGKPMKPLDFPTRNDFIESIDKAQYKGLPGFAEVTDQVKSPTGTRDVAKKVATFQEAGTRPSCPLTYELYADQVASEPGTLKIRLTAASRTFGAKALGSPFMAYSYVGDFHSRAYALVAGDSLEDTWEIKDTYHVRVDGPNGFMREFIGGANEPHFDVQVAYSSGGDVKVQVKNLSSIPQDLELADRAYGAKPQTKRLPANGAATFTMPTAHVHGWYDLTLTHPAGYTRNFAGRVETGRWSTSDPQFGRV